MMATFIHTYDLLILNTYLQYLSKSVETFTKMLRKLIFKHVKNTDKRLTDGNLEAFCNDHLY